MTTPELDRCVSAVIDHACVADKPYRVYVSPQIHEQIVERDRRQNPHTFAPITTNGIVGYGVGADWYVDAELPPGEFRIVDES